MSAPAQWLDASTHVPLPTPATPCGGSRPGPGCRAALYLGRSYRFPAGELRAHTRAHASRSPRICGSPRRRDSKANLEKGLPRGFGQSGRSRARRGCDPLRVHGKSFAGEKPSASSFLDLVSEFFPKGLTKFLSACHLTVNHPPGDQPSKFYSCFVFSYYMYVFEVGPASITFSV